METAPKALTLKELLFNDRYRIPIYQRNYDWSDRETLQLIEDIADYASKRQSKDNYYYIGSMVVYERYNNGQPYYEIIDGQQRMMTLTIMINVLRSIAPKHNDLSNYQGANVEYEHREMANEAIMRLAHENKLSQLERGRNIYAVYHIIKNNVKRILASKGLMLDDFITYLMSKVIIMRIPVPKDTNLNHYFEIMNSRGEQLEKHEIVKARLMEKLQGNDFDMALFELLWEACSDMSRYVQMNLSATMGIRTEIFSDSWNDLRFGIAEFDTLRNAIVAQSGNKADAQPVSSRSIDELFQDEVQGVRYPLPDDEKNTGDTNERFSSIINFPNFLLHVLKIVYHHDYGSSHTEVDNQITLDDKQLLDHFDAVLSSLGNDYDKKNFVKRFIMALLKVRHLFDRYVIKRDMNKERWSLLQLKKNQRSGKVYPVGSFNTADSEGDNESPESKDIIMLEAMFHVSAPTQTRKHWLNAVLYYLYTGTGTSADDLRGRLYQLACTYMQDRYLSDQKTEFEDIIYLHDCKAQNHTINWDLINNGCGVENFVFNFYDYLIWKKNPTRYPQFEFTYRTSVEHFYPQHPMDGRPQLDERFLDSFGNLCLISRGMNSKFSNNMPKAKVENFGSAERVKELSLKLNKMMDTTTHNDAWGENEIIDSEQEAQELILKGLL